jgi:hypothetical protein
MQISFALQDPKHAFHDSFPLRIDDAGDRVVLYRSFMNAGHDTGADRVSECSSKAATELALLERRAEAEGSTDE